MKAKLQSAEPFRLIPTEEDGPDNATATNDSPRPHLRDDPERMARVMESADREDEVAEMGAQIRAQLEQERIEAEAIAAEAEASAQQTIAIRGRLRAMGIQGVVEARKLMGRGDAPWTDFDADVAYSATNLFLTVCGLGLTPPARDPGVAVIAEASERKLSAGVDAGIAKTAAAGTEGGS